MVRRFLFEAPDSHAEEGTVMVPARVIFTDEAVALVRSLKATHGPLIFHLSGGCCEGSAPMCFRQADFRAGARDVLLGAVEDCPFYVGEAQFAYWAYCEVTVDVTTGGGDSFSLEAADGVRFAVQSRLFTDAEAAELDAAGLPHVPLTSTNPAAS